jgi:4-hydroxybenzoate polyprenyltransferase
MNLPLRPYVELTRLNKPIGIYLILWPTLSALWIASNGLPKLSFLIIFILGAVIVRSAGCIINDYTDRELDKHVERTKTRPLTSGKIKYNHALLLFSALGLVGLALTYLLNTFSLIIALIGALLTTLYPLCKRITYLPQFILGITFNLGVLMAFAATIHHLPPSAWLLYISSICWTVAYDTMYAMADRKDDIKVGIKSTAILFAHYDILAISLLYSGYFILLLCLGITQHFHAFYYTGILLAACYAIWQIISIRNRSPSLCFQAFRHSHRVGAIIFIFIIVALA